MSSPTQPTVLVVDDEADLRQLIAESLSADGFEVAQAPDAADAIERLKNFAYDALVVDLRLPDADGMEVLDAALSRYPDILAVMVTGFGGVTEAVSGDEARSGRFSHQAVPDRAAVARAEDAAWSSGASARRTPSSAPSSATAIASTRWSARAARCSRSSRPSSWSRR